LFDQAESMMRKLAVILGIIALAGGAPRSRAEGQGDSVVVVYNTRVPESRGVAEHYAGTRHVPAGQLLGLDLPETETMSREEFRDRLQNPLTKFLVVKNLFVLGPEAVRPANANPIAAQGRVKESKIRYVVLCYGVPNHVLEDPDLRENAGEQMRVELRRNEAAVDSELACLPLLAGYMPLTGPLGNSLYASTNSGRLDPTNGLLMVTRLDGPTAAIARGLVDKAIQAETDGLWGRAYFDLRGLTNGEYKLGDDWIRRASEVCRLLGFETVVDYSAGTFPAGFPMSQIAFYAGWYDQDASGPFARPTVEFMPGAFAYHLHSFSASTLRSTTRAWVGPLLARGATATMGCVAEPYLSGTPDMAVFFERFMHERFSFGEAAYASQRFLSWQTTVVGDPLYRPFAREPQEQHQELERRHSDLIGWSWLRVVDIRLAANEPMASVTGALEHLDLTRHNAVLMEKLADLYAQQGRASNSVDALQDVLKLEASPMQRLRVMLELSSRLPALGRDAEAYEICRQLIKEFPDYPDELLIYHRLEDLAGKLGKKDEAEKYQAEIARLSSAAGHSGKSP
jgi:uncharacterized protein (TIGR03790 family)